MSLATRRPKSGLRLTTDASAPGEANNQPADASRTAREAGTDDSADRGHHVEEPSAAQRLFDFSITGKSVAGRLGWSVGGLVLLRVRGLLTLPVVVRILGVTGYGKYSAALSAVSLITAFSYLNVPNGAARLIIGAESSKIAISRTRTIRFVGVAVSGLVVMVGAVIAVLSQSVLVFGVAALGCAMIIFTASSLHLQYFQQTGHLTRLTLGADWIGATVGIALALAMGPIGLLIGFAIAYGVMTAIAWPRNQRSYALQFGAARAFLGRAVAISLPLLPVGIASWALFSLDSLLLFHYRGGAETGYYSAAYSFASVALILPVAISSTWPATCQRLLQQRPERVNIVMRNGVIALAVLAAVGVALSLLVGPIAIPILGSASFQRIALLIPILVGGFICLALAKMAEGALYSVGHIRVITLWYGLGALLNLSLNFAYIPRYGMEAASWTTLIGYGVTALGLFAHWILARPMHGRKVF